MDKEAADLSKFYNRMHQLGFDQQNAGINYILGKYSEPQRFYHTFKHIRELLKLLDEKGLYHNDALFLATVYHDIVYQPAKNDNEEQSAQEFTIAATRYLSHLDEAVINQVVQIVLDTKTHQPQTELSRVFCQMDMNILYQPLTRLISYEDEIFKEFQFYDYKSYQAGRIDFLTKTQAELDIDLDGLISYVKARQPKIAVYPGSFNPFHKGHLNILEKAEKIFDKVIIARGVNPGKQPDERFELPALIKNRQILEYDNLLTDFVAALGYPVTIIRGLRNSTDLQFELNQYRYLQDLTGNNIDIVSIFCDREYEHISSTGIRQLKIYNKESDYLV